MKREKLFELLEPPPHGLTRLRSRIASRRVQKRAWPALVVAVAAALVLLLLPRQELELDLTGALTASLVSGDRGGPSVSALDGQALGLERLPSSNPQVVLYRVSLLNP